MGNGKWGLRNREKAIKDTGMECIYTDGNKSEEGRVGAAAWDEKRGETWETYVGSTATVWDGEVEGIRLAVERVGNRDNLLLTDSQAAIQAISKAGKKVEARTGILGMVVEGIRKRKSRGYRTAIGCVKALKVSKEASTQIRVRNGHQNYETKGGGSQKGGSNRQYQRGGKLRGDDVCRKCKVPETGGNVVFRCERHDELRLKWIQGCET